MKLSGIKVISNVFISQHNPNKGWVMVEQAHNINIFPGLSVYRGLITGNIKDLEKHMVKGTYHFDIDINQVSSVFLYTYKGV
jgi:hypothetical protein